MLPLQGLAEIVGEENIYYFGYDSLGDVMYETEKLHHYIHDVVLPKSPNGQVKICPISLGGTIAINYLETYPEDYELIKKMVFVIPAIDGSDIIGDLFTGNLSVFYDDDTLYEDLLVTLLGDTYLAYLLNMVLRILPDDVLKSALGGLANGLVDIAALRSTMIWALCPDEYYEEAKALWLDGNDELKGIAEDVEYFMNARANFEENLFALRETGCEIFNVACYDMNLFPLCKNYRTKNADRVIHAASTSIGATSPPATQEPLPFLERPCNVTANTPININLPFKFWIQQIASQLRTFAARSAGRCIPPEILHGDVFPRVIPWS